MKALRWANDFRLDLAFALRQIAKRPVFALVIIGTLGIAIGANTAVFSVMNGLLFRPLPVERPDELVVLAAQREDKKPSRGLSFPDFVEVREDSEVFSDVLGYSGNLVGLATSEQAERILVSYVTGNYFSMLGVQAAAGRLLVPGEGEAPGADPVIVLGHSYWMRRFAGDPGIVGQGVRINGSPYTVAGVAEEGFQGLLAAMEMDAYLPLAMESGFADTREVRDRFTIRTFARLRPGVDLNTASRALEVLSAQIESEYPETHQGVSLRVFPEKMARPEPELSEVWPVLIAVFLGLVGLVLLMACFNVASLFLVRANDRRGEIALRLSLGADSTRIFRQLLVESLALAFVGGLAGLLLGHFGTRMFESLPISGDLPVVMDFHLDWRVFSYVALLVLASSIFFGLVPTVQSFRGNLVTALLEQGRSGVGARQGLRKVLVILQVTVSLVLLVVAGLFIRSLAKVQHLELGFRTQDMLTASLDPGLQGYSDERIETFYDELLERARNLPGVRGATLSYSVPLGNYDLTTKVAAQGRLPAPGEVWPVSLYNAVGDQYLSTLEIPLLRGRDLTSNDRASTQRVAIVNETMAERLWPGQEALGKRFVTSSDGPEIEVVGVARNAKYGYLFEPAEMFFYIPVRQEPRPLRVLHLQALADPMALARDVRALVRDLDPNLPVFGIHHLAQKIEDDANGFLLPRIAAILAGVLGGIGLFLALTGIYGMVSFDASRRHHEIGIRKAMGARRGSILQLILRQTILLVSLGVIGGLALCLVLGRGLSSLLYGIPSNDPLTFGLVSATFVLVAGLASYLPSRRASRLQPAQVLRSS